MKSIPEEMGNAIKISSTIDLEMRYRVSLQSLIKLSESIDFKLENWDELKQKVFSLVSFLSKALQIEESTLTQNFQKYCKNLQMAKLQFILIPEQKKQPFFLYYSKSILIALTNSLSTYYPLSGTEAIHLAKLSYALYQCLKRTNGKLYFFFLLKININFC